jgi:hypothetical protein
MNQLVLVSNKATPFKFHYTHHTRPSFIFRLRYPQKSGPCLRIMIIYILIGEGFSFKLHNLLIFGQTLQARTSYLLIITVDYQLKWMFSVFNYFHTIIISIFHVLYSWLCICSNIYHSV